MANFFVVFNQQETLDPPGRTGIGTAKTLGPVTTASFCKVEATAVADAQEQAQKMFPGRVNTTPIVVTEAAWKSS